MKRRELNDDGPTVTSTLGESRSRILAMIQEAEGPLGVIDISAPVRLHPNTVRFHLDALAESGLVERTTEERTQPGRPRTLYTSNPDST
ncbi:MAG: ArsR family transcriptional regulator, partial [Mycobacteriaceae bacterium]